jgi:hypothetical protein
MVSAPDWEVAQAERRPVPLPAQAPVVAARAAQAREVRPGEVQAARAAEAWEVEARAAGQPLAA